MVYVEISRIFLGSVFLFSGHDWKLLHLAERNYFDWKIWLTYVGVNLFQQDWQDRLQFHRRCLQLAIEDTLYHYRAITSLCDIVFGLRHRDTVTYIVLSSELRFKIWAATTLNWDVMSSLVSGWRSRCCITSVHPAISANRSSLTSIHLVAVFAGEHLLASWRRITPVFFHSGNTTTTSLTVTS